MAKDFVYNCSEILTEYRDTRWNITKSFDKWKMGDLYLERIFRDSVLTIAFPEGMYHQTVSLPNL